MIELKNKRLIFTFPEVHPQAELEVSFHRTLRIPDDENAYPLPPGLGKFPLKHVDDFAENLPAQWIEHGGVMFPMYQSEAMWINFHSRDVEGHRVKYPFAVKVATGKINAVTGEYWLDGFSRGKQDYLVIPNQPWLDGYCVEEGFIRQFVAMPLGDGYSAEAQISGSEDVGGLQITVYPMKKEAFEKRWPKRPDDRYNEDYFDIPFLKVNRSTPDMGLAPGGRMRQEIYADQFDFSEWETDTSSRCFVHIANSLVWEAITGKKPATTPPSARDYSDAGLPWFEYYGENKALPGSDLLDKLKSIVELGKSKRASPLPENKSTDPGNIVKIKKRKSPDQVREWCTKKNG